MTILAMNPFRPTRWEHHSDGRPLIWFTEAADLLAAAKSTYVYGSRGSGKTSLLKGICWEDLCFNESLRLQRRLADFQNIGIYIRFPDHISASMSFVEWAKIFPQARSPEHEYFRFFSLAVELICLERTLEACHALRIQTALTYKPAQELRFVEDFIGEYPELGGSVGSPRTFLDLARSLRGLVRRMNEACGRGTIKELIEYLPAREPNQLLAFAAERLADAVRMQTQFGERSTGFKFCLDDCEVLSPLQKKCVNSLVRLSRSPVSWVVSAVGTSRDDSDTFIESQPLTDADRKVVSLDDRASADFRQLCQSVVSLRLLFSLPEASRTVKTSDDIANFFQLEQRLGRRDVNDMMALLVRRSARPKAKALHVAASRLWLMLKKASPRSSRKKSSEGGSLPYYETYVLLHWQGREDAFKTDFNNDDIARLPTFVDRFGDPGFEAWLRRKQVGALLHFASSLGVRRLPLAGSNVIVSLADGSIRDFLEIMGEIYETYVAHHKMDTANPETFERFATSRTPIGATIQTTGIYSASSAYVEGISRRSEVDTDVISRLVNGLGHYTALLQSNPDDPRTLASAERGVFFVDFGDSFRAGELNDVGNFVASALRQAELAGYLRTVEVRKSLRVASADGVSKATAFRLHRRFAPHFRFSFRGAYEPVVLSPKDIAALCVGAETQSAFAWAVDQGGTARKSVEPQIPLPLTGAAEDV